MTAFQAKIAWKRLRKREYKNYHSVTYVGKGREREIIKIIVPFRSYSTRNRKLQQNSKKIQKIKKKCHYGFNSSKKRVEKAEKERK